ncbi:MAG: type II toxin-antitoxin system RelE/ParE family toxin [Oscillospiraceae bacterium]
MKLCVSPAALQDLKDIKEYISEVLCNPTAAKRTVKKIISEYKTLTDSPYIGTSLKTKINIDTPFRYLVSGNYLIFYQVNDNIIEIHRIIYGRRDYIRKIFQIDIDDQ